jgi:L-amino acid N-acyltransferase YncA
MLIREAVEGDISEIQAIYAHHVLHGTGTFEEIPPSVEEMQARWRNVTSKGCAWIVSAGTAGVAGYGYYQQIRDRSAYRFTAEDSIYVREDVRGQGVGKALVVALLQAATEAGYRQMIAIIGDSENIGSIGVHTSLGFRKVGVMHATGLKFGRWLDTVYMQRALGSGDADVPT